MATPTELAREAVSRGEILRTEFDYLRSEMDKLSLPQLREGVAVLEAQLAAANVEQLRQTNAVLEEKVARLEKVAEEAKQIPVILDRLNKLEEEKRESYKRVWQFFFLLAGVVLGVVGSLIAGSLRSNSGPSK